MATKKTAKTAKKKLTNVEKAEIGAGVLAAASALGAAGYYFYASKDAKKHRAAASKWAVGLKKDVQKRAKALKNIDARAIAKVVDEAAAAYDGVRGVSASDLHAAAMELKKNWQAIKGETKSAGSTTKKTTKKVAKAAASGAKKVAKSAKKAATKKKA